MAWAQEFLKKGGGLSGSYVHPDINEAEAMNKSEINKDMISSRTQHDGGTACYRYPIYIDNFSDKNGMPVVQECIHFTAVKQGGFSLQKAADKSSEAAAREAQVDTVTKGGGGSGGGGLFGFLKEVKGKYDYAKDASQNFIGSTAVAAAKSAAQNQQSTQQKENVPPKTSDDAASLSAMFLKTVKGGVDMVKGQLANIRQTEKNLEHCFLYMPASLSSNDGAQWGAEGLGAGGNLLKTALRTPPGTGGGVSDALKDAMGGVAADIGKLVAVAAGVSLGGAAGALGAAALVGSLGSGLRAAGRFATNPFEEQLFNGIGFREFSFEFALAPASEAEGMQITKIIKMFRKNSRPNFVGGDLGEGLYTFPNEFAIKFYKNSGESYIENDHLPRIYNCVCTNVSTNFSPEGFWVALTDGRPVSYTLGLSFTETKKLTQKDIDAGY